jgi:hypothetical protein
MLEIEYVKSFGCKSFFEGVKGVLQNVLGHCEL